MMLKKKNSKKLVVGFKVSDHLLKTQHIKQKRNMNIFPSHLF